MASSTNNSSNISGNLNIQTITSSGARLLMTVPLSGFSGGGIGTCPEKCDGITAGLAIRYDNVQTLDSGDSNPSYGKYIVAQADAPANSEVVGIIEDVSVAGDPLVGDTGIATIVMSGQINLADGSLYDSYENPGQGGAAGGNDVYFLSAATGGILQNLAPTEPTQVIKPIYQVAPDSPWTGQVVNYIGYQAGGELVAEDLQALPVGAMQSVLSGLDTKAEREGWVKMGSELNLDGEFGKDTYGYAYETGGLGKISETVVRCYFKTAPTASMVRQIFKMRIDGKLKLTAQATNVSVGDKYVDLKFQASEYHNLGTHITADAYFATGSGALIQLSSISAKYLRFKLPTVSKNTSYKYITLLINNKDVKKSLVWMCNAPKDEITGDWTSARRVALSVSQDLTIKKITVNDTLKVENDNVDISNLADMLNAVQDDIAALKESVNGKGTITTNAYLAKK